MAQDPRCAPEIEEVPLRGTGVVVDTVWRIVEEVKEVDKVRPCERPSGRVYNALTPLQIQCRWPYGSKQMVVGQRFDHYGCFEETSLVVSEGVSKHNDRSPFGEAIVNMRRSGCPLGGRNCGDMGH